MNRIIKFRAWLIDAKKWYNVDITDSSSVGVLNVNYKYELCQFTGLLDKNGKEIYEGDVMHGGFEGHKSNRVVKWSDQNGAFFVLSNSATEKVDWDDCLTAERINIAEYEVIGNIYENPELLKETNETTI